MGLLFLGHESQNLFAMIEEVAQRAWKTWASVRPRSSAISTIDSPLRCSAATWRTVTRNPSISRARRRKLPQGERCGDAQSLRPRPSR